MNVSPHLLVVHDCAGFRELVARGFRDRGWSFVAVGSVPEAIEALERERFDLIISDCRMPSPGGRELLAFARRRVPDVPFILMRGGVEVLSSSNADHRESPAPERMLAA